jgi:hypothetical protein
MLITFFKATFKVFEVKNVRRQCELFISTFFGFQSEGGLEIRNCGELIFKKIGVQTW